MRALGITFISLALTTVVIGNAYYHKKQFYPSVVYITKSNPSMAVSIILRIFNPYSIVKMLLANAEPPSYYNLNDCIGCISFLLLENQLSN